MTSMTLTEAELAIDLHKQQHGYWAPMDGHPVEDWRSEVANDDTREGYHDWVFNRLTNEVAEDE